MEPATLSASETADKLIFNVVHFFHTYMTPVSGYMLSLCFIILTIIFKYFLMLFMKMTTRINPPKKAVFIRAETFGVFRLNTVGCCALFKVAEDLSAREQYVSNLP